jgi:hypothetical protein
MSVTANKGKNKKTPLGAMAGRPTGTQRFGGNGKLGFAQRLGIGPTIGQAGRGQALGALGNKVLGGGQPAGLASTPPALTAPTIATGSQLMGRKPGRMGPKPFGDMMGIASEATPDPTQVAPMQRMRQGGLKQGSWLEGMLKKVT